MTAATSSSIMANQPLESHEHHHNHFHNHHHNHASFQNLSSQQANLTSQIMPTIFTQQVGQTKLLASLILFVITLLSGYLPVRILLNQNYIQYAMFAGGGVLMATAFCHLIPEAHDNYRAINLQMATRELAASTQSANEIHNHTAASNTSQISHHHHSHGASAPGTLNVPYLEVTLCCGFFFMYLVEQLMVRFLASHSHKRPCDTSLDQLVAPGVNQSSSGAIASNNNSSATLISSNKLVGAGGGDDDVIIIKGSDNSAAQLSVSGSLSHTAVETAGAGSSSATGAGSMGTEFYKFIRGLLIVSAFGAHSIFDGVAIGSQETVEKVWTIFLAISCHKLIIAAVVGLELYSATLESHLWTLVHLSIFSVMSPIGIILVVLAQNSLHINSNHPAMILLQSFATGTLLYIVFVEILQPKEDQAYEKNKLGKSISLIVGFALMLLVLTLLDE